MATYKTTGLVLRRTNLGEADRIITFLTPDHGKVRAVARGVRRIKSRQAGHLELFSETELMLARGRNLDVVASARLVRHHGRLAEQYEALTRGYLIAEMVDRLTDEGGGRSGIFTLARTALDGLDDGLGPTRVELWFRLRLLAELGYAPGLEACFVCSQSGEEAYVFDAEHGSIAHRRCLPTGASLSTPAIKLWRLALVHGPATLERVNGADRQIETALAACGQFYDYLFGTRFRSARLLGTA